MSKEHELADTVDGILQQIDSTREELSRLTGLQQDPEVTLKAISIELYLVNKSIIALREQIILSLSWSECRTAGNQRSVDVLLFAISATLCNIQNQLHVYRNRRPMASSFRFLSRETPKVKTAELQTSLGRLRELNSVMQCIIIHFDTKTNETWEILAHCRSMLRKTEEWISSLGARKNLYRPSYFVHLITPRGLSKDLVSSYRLTRELQSEGMSMKHILDVYGKSDLKPFMIRDIFRRWRTYTDKEGYKTMLEILVHNGCDIVYVEMRLHQLYELGHAAFSGILGIIYLNDFDLAGTFMGLIKLWALLYNEPEWTRQYKVGPRPRRLPSIPINNMNLIVDAVKAFGGDVRKTYNEFLSLLRAAGLTESSIEERSPNHFPSSMMSILDLSSKDILHASNMILELWWSKGFNTRNSILLFNNRLIIDSPTSNILIYLHVLRRHFYSHDVINTLQSISAFCPDQYPFEVLTGDALWVAACCPDPIPGATLFYHAAVLIQQFTMWYSLPDISTYRKLITPRQNPMFPHWALMEQYNYSLAQIEDVNQILQAIFPPALVEEGYHWIWLMLDDFDIEFTKADAAYVSATFPELTPRERIAKIKAIHRRRGLTNMKYTWERFALPMRHDRSE